MRDVGARRFQCIDLQNFIRMCALVDMGFWGIQSSFGHGILGRPIIVRTWDSGHPIIVRQGRFDIRIGVDSAWIWGRVGTGIGVDAGPGRGSDWGRFGFDLGSIRGRFEVA